MYTSLKAAFAAIIATTGRREITASQHRTAIDNVIDELGKLQLKGVAVLATDPGTPDGPAQYLAATAGVYSHFNDLSVSSGEIALFKRETAGIWVKESLVTGLASQQYVDNLIEGLQDDIDTLELDMSNAKSDITTLEGKTQAFEVDGKLGQDLDFDGNKGTNVALPTNFNDVSTKRFNSSEFIKKHRKWVNAPDTEFTEDQLKVINSLVDIKFEGLGASTWAGDTLSLFIIAKNDPTLGNYFRIKNNTKVQYIVFDQTYVYHDGINIRSKTAYGITCTILEDFRYMDAATQYSPAIIIKPSEYWSNNRKFEISDMNYNPATTEELTILEGLINDKLSIQGIKGLAVFDIPDDPYLADVFAPIPFIKDFKIYGFVESEQYYISQLKFFTANGKTSIDIKRKSDNAIVSTFYQIIPADTLQILTIPTYAYSGVSFKILIDNTGMVADTAYHSNTLYFSKYRYTSIDSRIDISLIDYIVVPNLTTFDGTIAVNDGLDDIASGSSYGGSNSGSKNTYIGIGAGVVNTVAMKNTGIGNLALNKATSGWANTAVGYKTLATGTGTGALTISGTGVEFYANTAIGESSMALTTTGSYNTAIGVNSLLNNTIGNYNVGIGVHALDGNTIGNLNIAVGMSCLRNGISGESNIGIGYAVAMSLIGQHNIAIGSKALSLATTANYNIAIGRLAADTLVDGTNNIVIGYNADVPLSNTSYYLNIGNLLKGSMTGTKYLEIDGRLKFTAPTYADNAAAVSGGLTAGYLYKTSTGEVRIVI